MALRSYILVYDLDLGLWDIHQTGAVSFLAVPSGALWVKNGTLYHNGQAIGKAPEKVYSVSSFDGYAYTQGDKVIIVAMNGSTYTLPLPSGIDLAVSRLSEGFVACSSYQCTCTFNCTGFSAIAHQAFTPPVATETGTHYLLYANTVLYILEKPKPAVSQNNTKPISQVPANNTQPVSHAPTNTTTPRNSTPTTQPPTNTTLPHNNTKPQNNAPANTPANNTPPPPQNPTANTGTQSPSQSTGQGPSMYLAIPLILIALVLLGYTLYKKRYRYIS